MWILSKDKNFMANVNQAKFVHRDENKIHIYCADDQDFVSEFDSVEEAKQNFAKFATFWAAQTWDELLSN